MYVFHMNEATNTNRIQKINLSTQNIVAYSMDISSIGSGYNFGEFLTSIAIYAREDSTNNAIYKALFL